MRGATDSFLLPALDKREEEGGGVEWKSVTKLMSVIQATDSISADLRYSLKARMKCKDCHCVLNTLTVHYSVALNGTDAIRIQMADRKFMRTFEKRFLRSRTSVIRHSILQMLVDWSFLFGESALGKASADVLRELDSKHRYVIRPSALATALYSEVHGGTASPRFRKGLEFDSRADTLPAEKQKNRSHEGSRRVSMSCRSNLTSGVVKNFGSVKKLFVRGSTKIIKKHETALAALPSETPISADDAQAMNALQDVSRDCKNLQDLLSDVRVLLLRGHIDDVQLKMTVAEHLRNKCATSNNVLQDMITMKMQRVTAVIAAGETAAETEGGTDPIELSQLLQTSDALNAVVKDFEETHKQYIHHVDKLAATCSRDYNDRLAAFDLKTSLSDDSNQSHLIDGSTEWVEFLTPRVSESSSEMLRTSSSGIPSSTRSPMSVRPHSSLGTRSLGTKCPISSTSSEDRNPPPLPMQSPFADACALLEATRPKQTPSQPLSARTSNEECSENKPTNMIRQSSSTQYPELSSRSLTAADIRPGGSQKSVGRQSLCPAMKVRFTLEHLEEILDRFGKLN